MNSLELNKILGAILATLLLYFGIRNLADIIFHVPPANPQAYIVEGMMSADSAEDE